LNLEAMFHEKKIERIDSFTLCGLHATF
jgi:hypothetical protein